MSPSGVPYPERSLAPGTAAYPPVTYEVLKPIPGVEKGTIAPAFGEPGGGIQYKLPYIPVIFQVASLLAALTHPGHIVIYAPGDS
ncbi:TNT domain-containing protein, partial [Photorhabdus australis]|uniref:TNT domain-containing protein n=1 Tax=Photorhabdus australis TaxID=286156 RepID=UPI001F0AF12D